MRRRSRSLLAAFITADERVTCRWSGLTSPSGRTIADASAVRDSREGRSRMNILLIGSGGREHALAWKLAASPLLTKLFAAPGNPGIAEEAECVALDIADHAAVAAFCRERGDRPRRGRARGAAGRRPGRRSARRRHPRLRPVASRGAARRLEGLHQGSLRPLRHSDRRLWALHRRARRPAPMSARRARRSSSRPTASPPARA